MYTLNKWLLVVILISLLCTEGCQNQDKVSPVGLYCRMVCNNDGNKEYVEMSIADDIVFSSHIGSSVKFDFVILEGEKIMFINKGYSNQDSVIVGFNLSSELLEFDMNPVC